MEKFKSAKPLAERLIEKCEITTGCWNWKGAINANGYASIWTGTRSETASRVAYRLLCGSIEVRDGKELSVLHRCDNPRCVKPSHLFLGTHDDNMKDKSVKGRSAKVGGELNPRAKISAAAARTIKLSTEPARVLAQRFGISRSHVSTIRRGAAWSML